MKVWIIVLSIIYIFLFIVEKGIANYIRNDSEESFKYKLLHCASPLGIWHGCIAALATLVGFADLILIIITVVDKFL